MNTETVLQLDRFFTTGMTPFQMRNFVVNDFVTAYRKIRQIVVELKARYDNRAVLELDIEELQVQIDQVSARSTTDEHQTKLNDIQRRRYQLTLQQKLGLMVQMDFEIDVFTKNLEQLIAEQGGYDVLVHQLQSPEFQDREEAQFWVEKMARNAHSDLINFGTLSKGTLDTILLLPPSDQQQVMVKALSLQNDTLQLLSNSKDALLVTKD